MMDTEPWRRVGYSVILEIVRREQDGAIFLLEGWSPTGSLVCCARSAAIGPESCRPIVFEFGACDAEGDPWHRRDANGKAAHCAGPDGSWRRRTRTSQLQG